MLRNLLRVLFFVAASAWCAQSVAADGATLARPTLADLYSDLSLPDAAVSPSGRYIAVVSRHEDFDQVQVIELSTAKRTPVAQLGHEAVAKKAEAYISAVYWKTDERVLFRTSVREKEGAFVAAYGTIRRLGDRIFAVSRDGTKTVRLLADTDLASMEGTLDLGDIASFLPNDPENILLFVNGWKGATLIRVNVLTGAGKTMEPPDREVWTWMTDVNGLPVIRVKFGGGAINYFRKESSGAWKKFYELPWLERKNSMEFELVATSDRTGYYYVLARPPGKDRRAIYLYDLASETFGDVLFEHPQFDLSSAVIARDGKRVLSYCYVIHATVCEFTDPKINAHMRGIRKFFGDTASVNIYDLAEDSRTMIVSVDGPDIVPGLYYYQLDQRSIEQLGARRSVLSNRALPTASVFSWKARDGLELSGYLTIPAGAKDVKKVPLIVNPHGGPEARDQLMFDEWVQYVAARGYAVFQPNFRGSDGYGKAFARKGYGEFGRKMQDDVTDGLRALIASEIADPDRVCIFGASYGGYAALVGVSLTPDLYRCAVSIAGVTDLDTFAGWRRRTYGPNSQLWKYSLETIGDPEFEGRRMAEVSPARLAKNIKAPVLLIHGTDDDIVPMSQAEFMRDALNAAGNKTTLIKLEKQGHPNFRRSSETYALSQVGQFLWQHLGPGHGVSTPPEVVPPPPRPN